MGYNYKIHRGISSARIKLHRKFRSSLIGALASVLAVGAVAFPALAANNGTDQIGPVAGASQDGGTCGNPWANDTYTMFFTVHDNGNGTFAVRTAYKDASFVTNAGLSPGACETTSHHGTTVAAGISGSFRGFVDGTVTSSTYNPAACDTPGVCTNRTTAIAALFGGSALYSLTSYNFEYNSPDPSLQYRSWHENFNMNSTVEQDVGDIANL